MFQENFFPLTLVPVLMYGHAAHVFFPQRFIPFLILSGYGGGSFGALALITLSLIFCWRLYATSAL